MQSVPGSTLEVIETEFFFQLLVSLLANPSRLDDARQGAQVHLRRQVGEIVFLLSRYSVFADQPSLVAGQMLLTLVPDPLRRSVGNPHAGDHLRRFRCNVWDRRARYGSSTIIF